MSPGDGGQRSPVKSGRVDRDDEDRETFVLGCIGVGAGRQPDVIGVLDRTGEDLLAVDHVLVSVAHGPGLKGGQVGARRGLCVADGEVDLPFEDPGQETLLLLLGAQRHDRRTHAVQGEERQGDTRPVGFLHEDHLIDGPPGHPAVFLGPAEPQPAVTTHLADVAGVGRLVRGRALDGGDQVFEVLAELTLQRPLFFRELQVHVASGSVLRLVESIMTSLAAGAAAARAIRPPLVPHPAPP